MKQSEFQIIVAERIDKIKKLLEIKGQEYASDGDRLHNFYRASEFLRCTPERACLALMTKHLVSISDIVACVDSGKKPKQEMIEEKIGDAINYLILLEALLRCTKTNSEGSNV